MMINLIPACDSGVSYGSVVMIKAIDQFRRHLLKVVVICDDEAFEYKGENPTPDNITKANIAAAICLFREPGTIGQVTGFIQEEGINIKLSGTGGAHGKSFMKCGSSGECAFWYLKTWTWSPLLEVQNKLPRRQTHVHQPAVSCLWSRRLPSTQSVL